MEQPFRRVSVFILHHQVEYGIGFIWTGEFSDAFLGMQVYVWDTQSDMVLALLILIKLLW